jgi:hypothetical protein
MTARSVIRWWTTAIALCSARVIVAQTVTVAGVAYDSLNRRPFGGAVVQLVPAENPAAAGLTATADAMGHFSLRSVKPGRYLFGFQHPRLDSLGFDAVSRVLEVPATGAALDADLGLPSATTLATSFCGARRDSTGVMIGRVVDASTQATLSNGFVIARWSELRVDAAGVRNARPRVRTPIGADGRYVACGVPIDVPFVAVAESADTSVRSGTIDLRFAAGRPFLHRDFLVQSRPAVVAARAGTARLTGRVRTVTGQPIVGARVVLRDARVTDSVTTTDSTGVFRFSALPGGTYPLEVLKIGYVASTTAVDLRPQSEATAEVALGVVTAKLDPVTTKASREAQGFADRRSKGIGYALTSDDFAKRGAFSVSQALIAAPMLRVSGTSRTGKAVILGRGNCRPNVFLDGNPVAPTDLDNIDNVIPIGQLGAIEVFDSSTRPAQFGGGPCETIVMWSKFYVR